MLTLNYYRYGLKRRECWFCGDEKYKSKLTRYFQANRRSRVSILKNDKETWIIQLGDWDFLSIHKKTRYDIRKIQDEYINRQINKWSELSNLQRLEIIDSYNNFAQDKGINLINKERLDVGNNNVLYSCIQLGSSFSYHIYIHDDERIRLLYSWTTFDRMTSVTLAGLNKLHTSLDIKYAKDSNFLIFDFGGYKSTRMNGIDKFKSRFGGQSIVEYNYFQLI